MTRKDGDVRERSYCVGPIAVYDHGAEGSRLELRTGRDSDEWPAVLLTVEEERALAHWLLRQQQGFMEFLAAACPIKGKLRGRRNKLAQHLSINAMLVSHWVHGDSTPRPDQVPAVAAFFKLPPDQVERMILMDLRNRAEKAWRGRTTATEIPTKGA